MRACAAGRRPRYGSDRCAHAAAGRRPRCHPRRHRAGTPEPRCRQEPKRTASRRCRRSSPAATSRCMAKTTRPIVTAASPPWYFRGLRHVGAGHAVDARRCAGRGHRDRQGLRCCAGGGRSGGAGAKQGIWGNASAIKNAESPGDILAGIGRFMVVEGRVLSVRQAGATTYLNFGRNWTRGFAVTIPKRMIATFEAAGISLKSLENQKIRVRGWVEARGGPRIEVLRVGQIERLGEN